MIKRVHMTAGMALAAVIVLSGCGATKSDKAKSTPQTASTAKSGSAVGAPSADSAPSTGESSGKQSAQPTAPSTPTASPSATAAQPLKDGTAVLTHCADNDDPYATVTVRNPNGRRGLFAVKISYKTANGFTMAETYNQVSVPAKSKATVRVAVASAGPVDEIARCDVNPRATAVR
ncbi:hypothetical protein [Streptomyces sp. Act143]|uniref:hypothetical protein n=1 Tax=Streptomyces sp. Act143 TaxID=2200760 RepID=UPI0011B65A6D|nr:hypothetical protein [Streptomyces sp. Act143]